MRMMIAIGALLLLAGGAFLILVKNTLLMVLLGHLTYSPPEDAAEAAPAFAALAATPSPMPGVTFGAQAEARLACVDQAASPAAKEAFRRVNLVLLGAGAGSLSPLIPPETRRMPDLRPDLAKLELAGSGRGSGDPAKIAEILAALVDPDSPIHRGLDLRSGVNGLELRRMVDNLSAGGAGFADCVNAQRH